MRISNRDRIEKLENLWYLIRGQLGAAALCQFLLQFRAILIIVFCCQLNSSFYFFRPNIFSIPQNPFTRLMYLGLTGYNYLIIIIIKIG